MRYGIQRLNKQAGDINAHTGQQPERHCIVKKNPEFLTQTKHINICYHSLCEEVAKKNVDFVYVSPQMSKQWMALANKQTP